MFYVTILLVCESSENLDETVRMRKLDWVFNGRMCIRHNIARILHIATVNVFIPVSTVSQALLSFIQEIKHLVRICHLYNSSCEYCLLFLAPTTNIWNTSFSLGATLYLSWKVFTLLGPRFAILVFIHMKRKEVCNINYFYMRSC